MIDNDLIEYTCLEDNYPDKISFFVPTIPQQKGSKNAFKRGNKVVVVDQNRKYKEFERDVALIASKVVAASDWTYEKDTIVSIAVLFVMPRPKSKFNESKFVVHSTQPDIDKLSRCLLDALTKIVYFDDGRVCSLDARKIYENSELMPGVAVSCKIVKTGKDDADFLKNTLKRTKLNIINAVDMIISSVKKY